ncbi:unnamed protein product [Schistocephalus solidus]|uniref:Secreted protein n=1 Tax=Schistocephalus solidus TaxID=70667 RepID=A0A183SK83_SCHSO|nr:unnamed protein product [Schistocephalus solidus]
MAISSHFTVHLPIIQAVLRLLEWLESEPQGRASPVTRSLGSSQWPHPEHDRHDRRAKPGEGLRCCLRLHTRPTVAQAYSGRSPTKTKLWSSAAVWDVQATLFMDSTAYLLAEEWARKGALNKGWVSRLLQPAAAHRSRS